MFHDKEMLKVLVDDYEKSARKHEPDFSDFVIHHRGEYALVTHLYKSHLVALGQKLMRHGFTVVSGKSRDTPVTHRYGSGFESAITVIYT